MVESNSILQLRPRIVVFGVGGGGCNATDNMVRSNLEGVEFVASNTDAQALSCSLAEIKLQLGTKSTAGLGAGAKPEIGRIAAEEQIDDIMACLEGANMVFITAGMGGGTGTGAAPVVARAAKDKGNLAVGVVTKPFKFEGTHRMKLAEQGIVELQRFVDTLIVIPNQNLFRVISDRTTVAEAFKMADEVLHDGVRGITDLITRPGIVNLDFADVRRVIQSMGKALMGTGEASGDDRAVVAAERAISNPLLDDVSLRGARSLLINITGGSDIALSELDRAVQRIGEEVCEEAEIIFGSTLDAQMEGKLRVSVVATGISSQEVRREPERHPPSAGDNASPGYTPDRPFRHSPPIQPEEPFPAPPPWPPGPGHPREDNNPPPVWGEHRPDDQPKPIRPPNKRRPQGPPSFLRGQRDD